MEKIHKHIDHVFLGFGCLLMILVGTFALTCAQRFDSSPPLVGAINAKLALYNKRQDFVGLSFDGWAEAVGVTPLEESIYLRWMR